MTGKTDDGIIPKYRFLVAPVTVKDSYWVREEFDIPGYWMLLFIVAAINEIAHAGVDRWPLFVLLGVASTRLVAGQVRAYPMRFPKFKLRRRHPATLIETAENSILQLRTLALIGEPTGEIAEAIKDRELAVTTMLVIDERDQQQIKYLTAAIPGLTALADLDPDGPAAEPFGKHMIEAYDDLESS